MVLWGARRPRGGARDGGHTGAAAVRVYTDGPRALVRSGCSGPGPSVDGSACQRVSVVPPAAWIFSTADEEKAFAFTCTAEVISPVPSTFTG